ncbi:MAG: Ada metal-binding domain-containing protein [Bilifractor sp.]|jgi:hypothetical protein
MNRHLNFILKKLLVAVLALTATFSLMQVPVKANSNEESVYMYRMYNPNSGEHFYTASVAERNHLYLVGWNYEGIGWNAPKSSKTPVYRLYNPNAGDHHYTTSVTERNQLVACGWNYEGIGWYSDDKHEVPLYRQYNPNARTGTHNYTTSAAERDGLVALGWHDENIGWYGTHEGPNQAVPGLPQRPTPAPSNPSGSSTESSYVGNVNSKIFHRPDCPSVKRMKEKNKRVFSSRQEAVNSGYKACKDCRP